MGRTLRQALVAAMLLALNACATAQNYLEPAGPGYYGGPVTATVPATYAVAGGSAASESGARANGDAPAMLHIVSFNIQYAVQIERSLDLLQTDPALRSADVILLQEMDEDGTWLLAEALGMHYAFYPAMLHVRTGRDFGNAVLSRYPIVEHEKLLLPHTARITRSRRTATAATLDVNGRPVRVYSTHLGTGVEIGPQRRRDQLRMILDDAARYPRVVLGGDLNSERIGRMALAVGYEWPTADGPPTGFIWRLDHILFRGIGSVAAGTVLDRRGASDHRPVWAIGILP